MCFGKPIKKLAVSLILLCLILSAHTASAGENFRIPEVSFVPRAGYAFHLGHKVWNTQMEDRHAMLVMPSFELGGGGWVWQLAPIYSYIHGGEKLGDAHALSAYMGLAYKYGIGRVYPFIGGGLRGGYLFGTKYDLAWELHTRVPMGVVWYFADKTALYFEVGLMYGILGLRGNEIKEMKLGSGFSLDTTIGFQFP